MKYFNASNIRFKSYGLALCAIVILMLLASIGSAEPSLTVKGDTITGTGFVAKEKLDVTATHSEDIAVKKVNGEYSYSKDYKMEVLDKNSKFKITVSKVKTLTITVRPDYTFIRRFSYTGSYTPNTNDKATATTDDLIPLKYKVTIEGKSKNKNNVNLNVQDISSIKTNKNGGFTYNIAGLPAGTYTIDIDGNEWSLVIGKKNTITPQS